MSIATNETAITGTGYLRAWQLARVAPVHRKAASRLSDAASEWISAHGAFKDIDETQRALQERADAEKPADDRDEETETYGG